MKFVIITGMSGAGKGTAVKIMEDMGYYCVDNLPISLIEKFAELSMASNDELEKVAVSIDIRNNNALSELGEVLERIRAQGISFEILFLEAEDEVLIKRYKETRRNHPLSGGDRIDKGIVLEREKLEFLKKQADYIIDTSRLLTRELKLELEKIFVQNQDYKSLFVTILSFGFKYGIPTDSDLVFDVRFLPNPYYVEGLRAKNGNDKEVQDFVMQYQESHDFLDKLQDMVEFLIPNYISEGKNQLVISIGCTGGKHRSVTLANELYNRLKENSGYGIKIEHRDIGKDALRGK
ncbi:MAG: RNase adapter RapZ [Lachnospiraceae bacterium]|nr:RNase adapter RapZ [Lachnospiraceae bacterium]MDD7379502.1 RNase adapter RapZ [Lachnospiraceae bacterium]MDY4616364.1 RNase adapter RapZ [Lachnospiraceae bacterium]MDY5774405.1 RNase adapter RapZ [Lachnospiraceae bacterium]